MYHTRSMKDVMAEADLNSGQIDGRISRDLSSKRSMYKHVLCTVRWFAT